MRCVRCSLGENSWRVVVWCLRSCEHWMRCVRSSLGENSSGVWCLWSCEHWMQEKRCLSLTSATSRCMDCRPFPVFLWRNNLQKKSSYTGAWSRKCDACKKRVFDSCVKTSVICHFADEVRQHTHTLSRFYEAHGFTLSIAAAVPSAVFVMQCKERRRKERFVVRYEN